MQRFDAKVLVCAFGQSPPQNALGTIWLEKVVVSPWLAIDSHPRIARMDVHVTSLWGRESGRSAGCPARFLRYNVVEGKQMLNQERAYELMVMSKRCANPSTIHFPLPGDSLQLDVETEDGREKFILDVNRKGKIKLTKCTYQERYEVVEILLRLDVDGPPHQNPDGEEMPSPHLHVYREGYGDKWAKPVPAEFSDTSDLVGTLQDFMKYCNVRDCPSIQRGVE